MTRFSTTGRRFAIRACYLVPLFAGALLLIPALVPHIFFLQGTSLSETVNLFDLLGYLRAQASNILHAEGAVEPATYRFALLISALTTVAWFLLIWYAVFALFTAVLSVAAFGASPSAGLNTAKRVYRIFVPNRVFYGIFCFLPAFAAFLPILYAALLRAMLKSDATVHFYGPSDFFYTLAAGIVCVLPFCLLLRAQKQEKMDLFRLYKT